MEKGARKELGWVTYINPFRIVVPDHEEPLKVDLKEINSNTYNHGKLCQIVTSVALDELSGYKMLVCYDGALVIPKIGKYRNKEEAVNLFNRIISCLILSGIFCEAIDQRDIVWGNLLDKVQIWPVDLGNSASSVFHGKLRMRIASNLDTIILSSPRSIKVEEFLSALSDGESILGEISNLTPSFFARGITEITYKNWSLALSSLWITVEQLTDHLWEKQFLKNAAKQPDNEISGRLKAMRQDNRTWSSSVKQELLYQSGVIDGYVFERLYPARQARNRLVHDGKDVDEDTVKGLFSALIILFEKSITRSSIGISQLELPSRDRLEITTDSSDEYIDWKEV